MEPLGIAGRPANVDERDPEGVKAGLANRGLKPGEFHVFGMHQQHEALGGPDDVVQRTGMGA
jgi:hypothetical protein